jgi:molybdenum cofactor guanylyltransferase
VRTTGIVLAGGRSSRFPPDKLAVEYRGAPLLHHPILRLAEVCDEVLVVIAPGAEAPTIPMGVPARLVRDELEAEGPLAGLAAGLAQAGTEWALVAGGDMPELMSAVLIEMQGTAELAQSDAVDAVALRDGTDPSPLPMALKVEAALPAARVLLQRGERRLVGMLEALRTAVIDEATWTELDPDRLTLRDIDVPDDLTS